jgi:hypothetical protein
MFGGSDLVQAQFQAIRYAESWEPFAEDLDFIRGLVPEKFDPAYSDIT